MPTCLHDTGATCNMLACHCCSMPACQHGIPAAAVVPPAHIMVPIVPTCRHDAAAVVPAAEHMRLKRQQQRHVGMLVSKAPT
eukprot:scaffold128824_cov22-Tisochrysis_lutea.AAC.2